MNDELNMEHLKGENHLTLLSYTDNNDPVESRV